MTNGNPSMKEREPVLIANSLTGLLLGIAAVAGYTVSDPQAALLGQVVAFAVPVILNLIAGYVARQKVSPTDRA